MEYISLVVWILLTIFFIIAETASEQLISIWFALGSVAAFFISLINPKSTLVQIVVFTIVSTITFVLTRPLIKKLTKQKIQPTNADRHIGAEAVVTEEINNRLGKGYVKVKGVLWTARSVDDKVIPQDEVVIVRYIEGVKLMVEVKS